MSSRMGPTAAGRRPARMRISLFTRMRAWWLGLDSAEGLARYGELSMGRTLWMEWKGSIVIAGCLFSFLVGRQQSIRANEILDNIEVNRQRYYRREFTPEYVPGAPSGVYDGAQGYLYSDAASGLKVNADNKITSDESVDERQARLAKVNITSEMVKNAEMLLRSRTHQPIG